MNTGVAAIETTIQTFNGWLREIEQAFTWNDREKAYHALRAVLQNLRDHLAVEEAAQLAAQLPTIVRGIYWEGWRPTGKPNPNRRKQDFLDAIDQALGNDPSLDAEEVARGVLQVVANHVSNGEMEDVRRALPKGIRELMEPLLI